MALEHTNDADNIEKQKRRTVRFMIISRIQTLSAYSPALPRTVAAI
jgi:hypothetical protein